MRAMALVLVALLGGAPIPATAGPGAMPAPQPRRLAAARLPRAELGSEFWTLAARFDTGHTLLVELCITNVGLGDGNAAVIGHLIEPGGRVHRFDQARRAAGWQLSRDRLRISIGGVELDQANGRTRLSIHKKNLQLELGFQPTSGGVRLPSFAGADRGFDVLELGAPAEAALTLRGEPRLSLRGVVASTHRWVEQLESAYVRRRIELFALERGSGAYLVHAEAPGGESQARLVLRPRGGRLRVWPVSLRSRGNVPGAPTGFPVPSEVRFEGEGLRGRFGLAAELVRYDPLADLPRLVRIALAPFLRWRTAWSASPFEIEVTELTEGGGPRILRGRGLANITYFQALPVGASVAMAPPLGSCPGDCP